MFSSAELEILLKARDEASAVLSKAGGNLGTFAKNMDRFVRPALLATTVSAGALVGAVGLFVRAAMEGEVESALLETAVKNTGIGFDDATREGVERFVKSLENMSGFSESDVRSSLTMLILQTGNLEEAENRLRIAADLARLAHIPLNEAARLLGKITPETTEALRRFGIQVADNATVAEVFALIEERAGGAAAAYGATLEGKWEKVQNRLHDAAEEIGKGLTPTLEVALDQVEQMEANQLPGLTRQVNEFTKTHPEVVAWGLAVIGASVAVLALGGAVALLGAVAASPVVTLALVAAALYTVYDNAKLVTDNWNKMGEALHRGDIVNALANTVGPLAPVIEAWGFLAQRLQDVYDAVNNIQHLTPPPAGRGGPDSGHNEGGNSSATPGGWGSAKSPEDRPATLDDIYAAYARNHGGQQISYDTALRVLQSHPYWSDVQSLADGGVAMARPGGTLVRVGEGGSDEVIAPLDRYSVVPRGTSGGDGSLTIVNNGTIMGVDDLREFVLSAVRTVQQSGGFRGVLAHR